MNQTWNENYIFVNEKHKLQENVLEKDVLFYEGTQKLQKIMNTSFLSQVQRFFSAGSSLKAFTAVFTLS